MRNNSGKTPEPLPPSKHPRFGFDQNFPHPIVLQIVRAWTPEIELVPLKDIDPGLTANLEDHHVIQGLWQRGYEGLVTCDEALLWLPEVVSMIKQTRFSVVACAEAGHDALKASGLLLTQLQAVAKRHNPRKPQIWILSVRERLPKDFAQHVDEVETRTGAKVDSLRLSTRELDQPVLQQRLDE